MEQTPEDIERAIKPDIPITINKQNYIMDAKWKEYETNSGRSDTFQLLTYMASYRSKAGALIYPKRHADDENIGPISVHSTDWQIMFSFIDLRDA